VSGTTAICPTTTRLNVTAYAKPMVLARFVRRRLALHHRAEAHDHDPVADAADHGQRSRDQEIRRDAEAAPADREQGQAGQIARAAPAQARAADGDAEGVEGEDDARLESDAP